MVRRNYAFIILGVGIVLVILGLLKVLPGGVMIGAALGFFGLVLTGLSFVRPHAPAPDAPPPLPPFERIAGLFYEPTRVFQNLRHHPRWLAPLLIISLLTFVYTTAFTRRLTPERIVEFTTDKLVDRGWVPAETASEMKADQIRAAKDPARVAGGAVNQVVFTFIFLALVAGLYMVGVLVFGGRIDYWQALAVAAHASLPVVVISRLLSLLILYLKDPSDIHPVLGANGLVQDNLGVLFSPAAHPVLYTAASSVGVLSFYGLWLVATGLRNTGERVGSTPAWSTAITLWLLGLLFFVGWAAAFPGFLS